VRRQHRHGLPARQIRHLHAHAYSPSASSTTGRSIAASNASTASSVHGAPRGPARHDRVRPLEVRLDPRVPTARGITSTSHGRPIVMTSGRNPDTTSRCARAPPPSRDPPRPAGPAGRDTSAPAMPRPRSRHPADRRLNGILGARGRPAGGLVAHRAMVAGRAANPFTGHRSGPPFGTGEGGGSVARGRTASRPRAGPVRSVARRSA
jgi:hypothetical protein